ncbi:MAG TPA: FKBP-type peptidyl-prolyl cis-trans isomerase [Solirubrobacterales bacterium]|nr:FKBP-type peptidyl-prolyl cis-trans isomerase [Solirubrobacterales bacterium]
MKKFLAVGLMLLLALQLTACGDSEGTGASDTRPESNARAGQTTTAAEAAPIERADPGDWEALKRIAGPYENRLVIPSGPAPEQEVIRDLKIGRGLVLERGDYFKARYVSFFYENGKPVERLWRFPSSYSWGLGEQVEAWEVGLEGIRVGGIRQLIAPARLAYGNGTLVYVVQVLGLE